jgi:hypothetical protein
LTRWALGDTVAAMTTQAATLESPRSARAQALSFLAEEAARDLSAPRQNLPFDLALWFKTVKLFHEFENEELLGQTPPENLQRAHRSELAKLIGYGEFVLERLRENDVTAQLGVTLADVEATLEELYMTQREWYGGMSETGREQILDEVFGGP